MSDVLRCPMCSHVDFAIEFEPSMLTCEECGEEFDEFNLEYIDPPMCKPCARREEGDDPDDD